MKQIETPRITNAPTAEKHILELQSEQIVEAGKNRILSDCAAFYAAGNNDGGALAKIARELTQ